MGSKLLKASLCSIFEIIAGGFFVVEWTISEIFLRSCVSLTNEINRKSASSSHAFSIAFMSLSVGTCSDIVLFGTFTPLKELTNPSSSTIHSISVFSIFKTLSLTKPSLMKMFELYYPNLKALPLSKHEVEKLLYPFEIKDMLKRVNKDVEVYEVFSRRIVEETLHESRIAEEEVEGETIMLGTMIIEGKKSRIVRLRLRDLTSHICILGSTGSGKTTTAATIAARLHEKKIPVLILDWHNEYARILKNFNPKVYNISNLRLDILTPRDVNPAMHIDFLVDTFTELFSLTYPQAYMLREALKNAIIQARLVGKEYVTFKDLIKSIENTPIRSGWDHETKAALLRRITPFTEGALSKLFNVPPTLNLKDLFYEGITIIELGDIRNFYAKKLIAYTVLKNIYDYCLRHMKPNTRIKHAIIIEEARNLMPAQSRCEYPILERMLAELRKFGECLIIVSQSPRTISEEALRNTNIKIVHSLKDIHDIRIALSTVGLNSTNENVNLLQHLKPGEALLLAPNYTEPILIKVEPHSKIYLNTSTTGLEKSEDEKGYNLEIIL